MKALTPRMIALLFAVQSALAGILILAVAMLGVAKSIDLSSNGVKTKGTVVGFVSNRSCKSAEVSYRDQHGALHQFNDDCPTSLKEGETVTVVYVRDRPTRAAVESEIWSSTVFLALAGLGLLGASAVLALKARRATQ